MMIGHPIYAYILFHNMHNVEPRLEFGIKIFLIGEKMNIVKVWTGVSILAGVTLVCKPPFIFTGRKVSFVRIFCYASSVQFVFYLTSDTAGFHICIFPLMKTLKLHLIPIDDFEMHSVFGSLTTNANWLTDQRNPLDVTSSDSRQSFTLQAF